MNRFISRYVRSFWGKTILLFSALGLELAVAWTFAPYERFFRISLICYGCAPGWFGGWAGSQFMQPRQSH